MTNDDREKNKGGRPRAAVPGIRVSAWIREPDYDRLVRQANRDDKTVSGAVRDFIKLNLK